MMGYPHSTHFPSMHTTPSHVECGPTQFLCDHISATHKTAPPPLLTLSTAVISGMVLWSAPLTMGVIRPLEVATATETSTVEEIMDSPATGSHTEFTSGINWEWVRYAQTPGMYRTK